MILRVLAVDQNIIKVGCAEYVELGAECLIDIALEGGWSVGESKGHDKKFEEAISGSEGGFPFIARFDSNQVVCVADVDLGDYLGSRDAGEGLTDQG